MNKNTASESAFDVIRETREIASTPSFRMRRRLGYIAVDAATSTALELSEAAKTESGRDTPKSHVLNLIGHIDDFALATAEIQDLRSQGAAGRELRNVKSRLVSFNHAIKDVMESHPRAHFSDIVHFTVNMHISLLGETWRGMSKREQDAERQRFLHEVRQSADGMRHESAGEAILAHTSFEYIDPETVGEDLKGADYYVRVGGRIYSLDFKSNPNRAAEKQAASQSGNIAIWSHINSHELGDRVRLSAEEAEERAPAMEQAILAAIQASRSQPRASRKSAA